MGNEATDSQFDSEIVKKIMERHFAILKEIACKEYTRKIKQVIETPRREYQNVKYQRGDMVYYQRGDGKAWFGPTKVFAHEEGTVFILQNGDLVKGNPCRVMPYEKRRVQEETDEVKTKRKKREKSLKKI